MDKGCTMIKSRSMRWTWLAARMWMKETHAGFLVGNPEVKKPLGNPSRKGKDNIKIHLSSRSGRHDDIYLPEYETVWSVGIQPKFR
jgi:hypothetical protein